jgi:hypothetical protein
LLALTYGFVLREPWILKLWPWELSRLSAIFLGSIAIAYGVPLLWIGIRREPRALAGLAIGLAVTFTGFCGFAVLEMVRGPRNSTLQWFAIGTALLSLASVAVYFWSRRLPFKELRAVPRSARVPMTVIALIVVVVGCALALRVPIFPWRLSPAISVTYGWIFFGAAAYFLYAFAHPSWANAHGQLMGFLAYALVLFGPFTSHLKTVPAELRLSLVVYLIVLTFGSVTAVFFLFANKASRLSLSSRDTAVPL